MSLRSTFLAGAVIALTVPSMAGSSTAGPLAGSAVLKDAAPASVEAVQYRQRRAGRWIGPAAAGFAAGAFIGGALASRPYYDDYGSGAYAYEPSYGAYAYDRPYRSGQRGGNFGNSCSGDAGFNSAFPGCQTEPPN
jgi:hypothetical protein